MRPKDIGTRTETAVVRYLASHGWPLAERRALHGTYDLGDITGTPGLVWEVKGGEAAKDASDRQIDAWLTETEDERKNAGGAHGFLVCQRRGKGDPGQWWAWLTTTDLGSLLLCDTGADYAPVRMRLDHLVALLRSCGWGDPS